MDEFTVNLPCGGRLVIGIDIADVERVMEERLRRMKECRPLLEKMAQIIRRAYAENFAEGGPGWAPLSPSTILKKSAAGLPALTKKGNLPSRLMQQGSFGSANILIASGALRDSYVQKGARGHYEKFDEASGTVEVGSRATTKTGVPYALFLDRGTRNMPARPQTIGPDSQAKLQQAVLSYLNGEDVQGE